VAIHCQLNKQGHTVLLTTHYLEEAEALCGRIAMLKSGRIVALDRTSALLKAASGNVLRFKTYGVCHRPGGAVRAGTGSRGPVARPTTPWKLNNMLAAVRESGLAVEDVEMRKADLEDVFIGDHGEQDMKFQRGPQAETAPWGQRSTRSDKRGGQTPHDRLANPAVQRSAALLEGRFQTVAGPVLTAMMYLLIFGHVLEDHVKVYDTISYTAFLVPGW
jgi:hypothetical protein